MRINNNPDLTHAKLKNDPADSRDRGASLIIEKRRKETTKKVSSLRVLVGGLSRLTRRVVRVGGKS